MRIRGFKKAEILNAFINDRGGISLYILAVLLIVCVVLPVYAVALEKLTARSSIDKIQDAITISVSSSYMALMPEYYTDAVIRLDQAVFEEKLNKLLSDNLEREFPGIEIVEEQVFSEGLPTQCLRGNVFEKPGVHLVVSVPIRYSAVRMLLPIKNGELTRMTVHGDVLFTLD